MILVVNCGSQSLKWKLFTYDLKLKKEREREILDRENYKKVLVEELSKVKNYKKMISVIGHRVVHGGKKFREPTTITPRLLKEIERIEPLAPLHNPFNVMGIKTAKLLFPDILQVAVFDTGFYKDLPEKAITYALPEVLRKKYGFYRYGFHGISHEYAAEESSKIVKKSLKKLKIISCHLGGGASITAVKNGKAVETSMGFTPMEGLVMMTRSGDIDPGIVIAISKIYSPKKADNILNNLSGLKGISGIENMIDILKAAERGEKRAKLALDIFVYRIQKYIGSYFAILGGCDIIVFTGAIGSGSRLIRDMICRNLNILKNTKIISLKPNEELAIARKIIHMKFKRNKNKGFIVLLLDIIFVTAGIALLIISILKNKNIFESFIRLFK